MIGSEFICVGAIALLAIGIMIVSYVNNQADKKETAWREFAKAHHLVYMPGKSDQEAYVFGSYRGYQVKLETFEDPFTNMSLYTRLAVLPENVANEVSSPVDDHIVESLRAAKELVNILSSIDFKLKGKIYTQTTGKNDQMMYYEQLGVETDLRYLQAVVNLLCNLVGAYPTKIGFGGEAVSSLQEIAAKRNKKLQPVITQLLQDIAWGSTSMFSHRASKLLCPRCLVYFAAHQVNLSWQDSDITYYGCRTCGQSHEIMNWSGPIIAVLDHEMVDDQLQQDKILRINWLKRRTLFDFDKVEIIQATDEEVERFAVQVGNDTDEIRRPRYQKMECTISPNYELSANTTRILQRLFGTVMKA